MEFNSPVKDATDVGAMLARMGYTVRQAENVGQRGFRRALSDFAEDAARSDAAVVFFSGFSIVTPELSTFLIPADARVRDGRDPEFEAIPIDLVIGAAARSPHLGLVIVDGACHEPAVADGPVAAATGPNGGGVVVACGARRHEKVLDGAPDGNSPFTQALLAHFESAKELSLGRVFAMIKGEVLINTVGMQEPLAYGSALGETLKTLTPRPEIPSSDPGDR